MRNRLFSTIVFSTIVLVGLCTGASAQASESPKTAVKAPRTNRGLSGLGFGLSPNSSITPQRLQQIYNFDSFSTGPTTPILIKSINYRMPLRYNTGNQGGQTIELAIDLSLAATGVTADTATATFASNLDAKTTKRVFTTKKLRLPILGTLTNPSMGFDFKIPVDNAAFPYLPSKKRALVVDIRNKTLAQSTSNYYIDGWTRARSGIPGATEVTIVYKIAVRATEFGTSIANGRYAGCPSSASKAVNVTHSSNPATLIVGCVDNRFDGQCFVANLAGVMTFGSKAVSWSLPGSNCMIVNDIILLFPFLSDARGDAHVGFPIPGDAGLVGLTFMTQMFWLDAKANTAGIVSSGGRISTIGRGFPATGSVFRQRGLVTQFGG